MKFPLVDTSEENGSIEVLPSTQYIAKADLKSHYDEVLTRGRFPSAHRLNMEKGTMWIQDVRMLHRGTPNTSNEPRAEIVVCYGLSWISIRHSVKVPPETYDGFRSGPGSFSNSAKSATTEIGDGSLGVVEAAQVSMRLWG
jgi:ectoine hydroxylase-related dioxygenase (phytanoyl-CoA dioxygenase family)